MSCLSLQVAAYIADGLLLSEAETCFYNCAAPLLAGKAECGMLQKGLAACYVTLSEAKVERAGGIQVAAATERLTHHVT